MKKYVMNYIKVLRDLDLTSNFKIELQDYRLTVLIPFFLAFMFVIILFFNLNLDVNKDYTIFGRFISIFLKPILEEIVFRGFLLGVVFIWFPKIIFNLIDKEINQYLHYLIIFLGIITLGLYFATQHNSPNLSSFYVRLFDGLLYSVLYVIYKRNLLPSIMAHITNNALIHFIDVFYY